MRIPVSAQWFTLPPHPARRLALGALFLSLAASPGTRSTLAQGDSSATPVRQRMQQSPQWAEIEKHLPNPATASPQTLETQGDILRARRFPEDAMDYYKYALARGGDEAALMNKLGLTELELRNVELARAYFRRAVKIARGDAKAWNNLGAVEYVDGANGDAVSDYKRAIKLDKHEAVYHANLSTAFFGRKDYKGARREMATALKLDPKVFDKEPSGGGVAAHVLTSEDRARFCFEMAKLYAQDGLEEDMLHSLAMASEAGMDVQREMHKDVILAKFELDQRVVVLVHNAEALRANRASSTASSAAHPDAEQPKPL
ncbi:MAG: tetratricopeptide repeat protein [Acidobacteriaceae bacterium]|jgi:tetratricopeptide (TPR) repeat protein